MNDEVLNKLAKHIGYDEGLPVVVNPGILDPKQFIDTVNKEDILSILKNDKIFGIDLDKYHLADKVVGYLNEELQAVGAVCKAFQKYV